MKIKSSVLNDNILRIVSPDQEVFSSAAVLRAYQQAKDLPHFDVVNLTTLLHCLKRCYVEDGEHNAKVLENPAFVR